MALRARLAGRKMFGTSFCNVKDELPPLEAIAEEFRAQARPQPCAQARLSDLDPAVRHPRGGCSKQREAAI